MVKHEIYIRVDYEGDYRIENVRNALKIAFNKEEPYDKLSKRFKKYTHRPRYPDHEVYSPNDYNLYLVHKDYKLFNYIVHFYNPEKQILSVDIYFRLEDKKNYQPLIFGFNEVNGNTSYYTYYHLNRITYKWFVPNKQRGSIGNAGLFEKEDLETRLLEELGLHKTTRKNKFVIRLDKKPTEGSSITYPKTGNNKHKITLRKSLASTHSGYEKYEHQIVSTSTVEAFYISFYNNSLYLFGNSGKLQYVDVYYKQNDDKLVLIYFKFQNGAKLYKLSEFVTDINYIDPVKHISKLEDFKNQDIKTILIHESEKFKQEIEFKQGSKENIYISEKNVCLKGTKFFSVLLTPNTKDVQKGTSIGPWIVYRDSLFYKNTDIKLDETSFQSIYNNRFNSIDVYYNDKNEPLLVEFVNDSDSRYFVRKDIKGNKWEEERQPIYVSDGNLSVQLQTISNPLFTNIGLQLEKKNEYDTTVTIKGTSHKSSISVIKQSDGPPDFKAKGYFCYEHKLFEYYKRLDTNRSVPKLVIEPAIGTIKIRLIGPDDRMPWPLTYTNPDYSTSTKNDSLFVYFGKSNNVISGVNNIDDSDNLPLLFCYNDKFYSPRSKDQYFGLWLDERVTGNTNEGGVATPQSRLKDALDRNFEIANEIDLSQINSYGIPCCKNHPYYNKKGGFNTKRVNVTKYKNGTHTMYVHRTVHKNNIGKISQTNSEYIFNQHTKKLHSEEKIDEVVVIYSDSYIRNQPVLILLNKRGEGPVANSDNTNQSLTYGYYYQDNKTTKGNAFTQYFFKHIKGGCKIMGKLMGQAENVGASDVCISELSQALRETWSELTSKKMDPQPSYDLEEDTSDCKGPFEDKEKESSGMCKEVPGLDKRKEEDYDSYSEEDEEEKKDEITDLNQLDRDEGILNVLLGEELIETPSGIDRPEGQDSDSSEEDTFDVEIIPTVESRDVGPKTVITTSPTFVASLPGMTEATKPVNSRTEAPGPAVTKSEAPRFPDSTISAPESLPTSDLRTPAQVPSLASSQDPSSVSHISTQSRETSQEVPKAKDTHMPEGGIQGQPSLPDQIQPDHQKHKSSETNVRNPEIDRSQQNTVSKTLITHNQTTSSHTPLQENREPSGTPSLKQEFTGQKLVVLFIEKQTSYTFKEFYTFLKSLGNFNIEDVLNTKDYVTVKPKEDAIWNRFKSGPYSACEHDFKKTLGVFPSTSDHVELKIFINFHSSRSVLTLFNTDQKRKLVKLNYKSDKNYIHVYFARGYQEPLIFCYNGNLYRPISDGDYDTNWFKLSGINCPCSSDYGSTVQQLLQELKKIEQLLKLYKSTKTTVRLQHQTQLQSPQQQTRFQPNAAYDGTDSSTGIIAGSTVGTVVVVGGTAAGIVAAKFPYVFVPVIKALV